MKYEHVKGRLEVAINEQEMFFRPIQENIMLKVQQSMGEQKEVDPVSFLTKLRNEIQINEHSHLYGGLLNASTDLLNELTN